MRTATKLRWINGTYVIDSTIVGVVEQDFDRPLFWAYACDVEWTDVRLGSYNTEPKARRAVEAWVKERL